MQMLHVAGVEVSRYDGHCENQKSNNGEFKSTGVTVDDRQKVLSSVSPGDTFKPATPAGFLRA